MLEKWQILLRCEGDLNLNNLQFLHCAINHTGPSLLKFNDNISVKQCDWLAI